MPLQEDMASCAYMEQDPPTDVEQPEDSVVQHRPMVSVVNEEPEVSWVAVVPVAAAWRDSVPAMLARGRSVVLPGETTPAAP